MPTQNDAGPVMCEILTGVSMCIIDILLPPEYKLIIWLPKTFIEVLSQGLCATKEICIKFVRKTECVIHSAKGDTIDGELNVGYEATRQIKLIQYHKGWLTS